MSLITRRHCDGCHREVPVAQDQQSRGWYSVLQIWPLLDLDTDSLDFCSLPCLSTWAAHRELEMAR